MTAESLQCFSHPGRGASGRCLGCHRYQCRECLTEHEGRVLCVACLATLSLPRAEGSAGRPRHWVLGALALVAIGAGWLFFYLLGHGIVRLNQVSDPPVPLDLE